MKKFWLVGVALAAGLSLSAAAHAQVRLGVAGPITGAAAAFGAQLKNGAEQAVEDINAAGGILGQKIQVFIGDDASRPEQGVSVANKFVGDGVKFVVGHFNSGVSIPASEVYNENGILQITPASTNPTFTERKMWNTFRTCGRDDQQGAVLGKHIAEKLKGKKVAVIHDKTPYGKGLADETKKTMNSLGVKEAIYEGINVGEKDFSALVTRFRQQGVEVVMFGGLHTEAGLLARQMRGAGVKAVLVGGDGITSTEFASIAGDAGEGTLMSYGPDPTKRPGAADVVKRFAAKKINPEAYTLYSYASVQVIKQAVEAAKSLDPKKVAEVISSGRTFETVLGPLSFDKKGDRTDADYIVYEWKKAPDGKLIYAPL
jgi:branched-chain amino acid transport system substrate-binding protein